MSIKPPWRITMSLDELVEQAAAYPSDIIVLRASVAPSPDDLRRYANLLGGVMEAPGVGDLRLLKYDATATNSTALSLAELSHHTDGTFLEVPPNRVMLSFSRADQAGGGVSTFFRLADVLPVLPGWVFEALSRAHYRFNRNYGSHQNDDYCVAPVLDRDFGGNATIRWKADGLMRPEVVRTNGTRADEAVIWLQEFFASADPISYPARQGETLLLPNMVTLHGRTALSAASVRTVLRIWIK